MAFPGDAAEPVIPDFWDAGERLAKPDLSELPRLRFLTTTDFPPFNFLDQSGRLAGFNVDLAREICDVLEITAKCQIQALPWNELDGALAQGEGEALIAGLAVSQETREQYVFSRPYLRFPARFVVPKNATVSEPLNDWIKGKRIGVIAGSSHESMLRDYFPGARVVTYSRSEWLYDDLKAGKLAGIFGDGMRLSFWLAGTDSASCCRFAGGPYLSPEHLGTGLAVAASPQNSVLVDAFDYALREINANGTFAELYLRYFPISFF
jgi:polar amino acid transport system substrate-binding protein